MYHLVLTVCLLVTPQVCRDVDVPSQNAESETACMRNAQFEIARWASEHPDWKVTRWRCAMDEGI